MEPLISIYLKDKQQHYQPGEELTAHYQIDAVEKSEILAVEASVLWYTEGKGDEDMAVDYFERRMPSGASNGDLRQLWDFTVRLPKSPLSYDGVIVKIRWCVRVRVFLRQGKETCFEQSFQLGDVPRGKMVPRAKPVPREEGGSHDPTAERESHDTSKSRTAT